MMTISQDTIDEMLQHTENLNTIINGCSDLFAGLAIKKKDYQK